MKCVSKSNKVLWQPVSHRIWIYLIAWLSTEFSGRNFGGPHLCLVLCAGGGETLQSLSRTDVGYVTRSCVCPGSQFAAQGASATRAACNPGGIRGWTGRTLSVDSGRGEVCWVPAETPVTSAPWPATVSGRALPPACHTAPPGTSPHGQACPVPLGFQPRSPADTVSP